MENGKGYTIVIGDRVLSGVDGGHCFDSKLRDQKTSTKHRLFVSKGPLMPEEFRLPPLDYSRLGSWDNDSILKRFGNAHLQAAIRFRSSETGYRMISAAFEDASQAFKTVANE